AVQVFLDFFFLVPFLAAYLLWGLIPAVWVLMGAVILQVAAQWLIGGSYKPKPITLASAALVLVFGTLTVVLNDPVFIKWKPTVLYWAMSVALFGARLWKRKGVVHAILASQAEGFSAVPARTASALDWAWLLFFVVMGALNIWVAYSFSEATWVYFKLFGLTSLTLVFGLLQGIWIVRSMKTVEGE
ncbi:MAG: septation protein IspZ, partial [Gammaproteobacteria bacterium]|nr:septation protein IspZ [Gammaproteobacteria bacterium]